MKASRYARIVGMSDKELALFKELWPLINKNAPASTEAEEFAQLPTILPQIEYDENQMSLTYEGDALHA